MIGIYIVTKNMTRELHTKAAPVSARTAHLRAP